MIKIRKGIFETNSSSSHSFVKAKNVERTVDEAKKEEIYLGVGNYGWGYEELTSWLGKADYLAVEASKDELKKNKLLKTLNLKYPNCTFKIMGDGVADYEERSKLNCGYIDHQSRGEIWEELNSIEDVYSLIFGDAKIIIDNDNH